MSTNTLFGFDKVEYQIEYLLLSCQTKQTTNKRGSNTKLVLKSTTERRAKNKRGGHGKHKINYGGKVEENNSETLHKGDKQQ